MEYNQLPERVRDEVPSPDDARELWADTRADPTQIPHDDCAVCDETIYHLPVVDDSAQMTVGGSCWMCGHNACGHNDWGENVHTEHVADPGAVEMGYNMALEDDDDASTIMCGHCYERFGEGNSIVVVAPGGASYSVSYDGTVIRDTSPYGEGDHESLAEAPDWAWDVIKALVTGTGWVNTDAWRGHHSTPDEAVTDDEDLTLTKVAGGWHSSMERSDLSDRINDLTGGLYHSPDAPDPLDFPVAVQFARTSNVCSVGIDVYAPEGRHDDLADIVGSSAAPGHAGLR